MERFIDFGFARFFRRIIGKFFWDNRGERKWFWDKKKKRKKRRNGGHLFLLSLSRQLDLFAICHSFFSNCSIRGTVQVNASPKISCFNFCNCCNFKIVGNPFLFFRSRFVLIKFVSLLRYQFTISSTPKPRQIFHRIELSSRIDHFYLNVVYLPDQLSSPRRRWKFF